ncbi:MAG: HlyD family efflux transporter periplasmic adaptor subunit [Bacteroidota bacterium]
MPYNEDTFAVNDLLGKPPGWLLNSGIMLVFIVVLGVLILAAFISYPDELTGEAIIQDQNNSVRIAPKITAPLDTVFFNNDQQVANQAVLGVLQSDANWREVVALDTMLQFLTIDQHELKAPYLENLGAIQPSYAKWMTAASTYAQYQKNNGLAGQKQSIQREIEYTLDLARIAEKQLTLFDQRIELETSDFQRQTQLAKEEVISAQEYEERKKRWLALQQEKESLEATLIQHRLRITQLQQQSATLSKEDSDEDFGLQRAYQQATEELKGLLQGWKEQYLLKAPLTGRLIVANNLVTKQLVTAGQTLFTIQPSGISETQMVAKISVPANGIGKIELGDKVIIRLDAYPEKEFGSIRAQLDHIAELPESGDNGLDFYQLEALLEEPLTTNYGNLIPTEILMSGTGTVITEERSILSRIFEQVLDIVKRD